MVKIVDRKSNINKRKKEVNLKYDRRKRMSLENEMREYIIRFEVIKSENLILSFKI
jgi:hypothetical protein